MACSSAGAPDGLGTPITSIGSAPDTTVAVIAPGVTHYRFTDKSGPWEVNFVRVDLRRTDLMLRHVRALDQLRGREKPSSMARRISSPGVAALVAVNADFFQTSGENENNQVLDGEWWKGLKVTDSGFDTFDNVHAQFAMDAANHPCLDRYALDATAWVRGVAMPVTNLNFSAAGTAEQTVLFTPRFGTTTTRDTTRSAAEAPLRLAGRRGDTLVYVRRGVVANASGSAIPSDGAIFAAYGLGSRLHDVQAIADGDTVKILLATLPRLPKNAAPSLIVGGWPRILSDGVIVAANSAALEGTIAANAEVRHPRTAVGFSRDSTTLLLLVVDGRSEQSVGMTIVELATLMRQLGAWHALNFDGGGSTSMVINGAVVNTPSDPTGEREVGDALLVIRK